MGESYSLDIWLETLISGDLDFDDVTYFLVLWCTALKFEPCAQIKM
jgi:hypothetical protein